MKVGLVRRGHSHAGGAEAYLRRFAGALARAGHECVLFSAAWHQDEWPHGNVIRVPDGAPGPFADALQGMRPREHCDFLFSMDRIHQCDCYRAGDGVHRAWLARRARQEWKVETWFRTLRPYHRSLLALEHELFAEGGARSVIANSHLVRNEIIRHFGCPEERIRVVYNGAPAAPDAAERARLRDITRRALGFDAFEFVVLFVGSGWERKGLDTAIRAINDAALWKPTLLVSGRGNPRACPRSTRTRFLGTDHDVRPLYAAADLFVLPTLYDPFSNACLEAMSFGLPVITTRDNGFSEIMTPREDGEIIEDPADCQTLALAIESWAPPDKRAKVRPRLCDKAARYSVEANLAATLEVIEGLR
jgi:UDP-glucose:(heptosyl)LPS alpha-1,3-glucosyltransferase